MAKDDKEKQEDAGMYSVLITKHWLIPGSDVTLPAGEIQVPARLKGLIPAEIIDGKPKLIEG